MDAAGTKAPILMSMGGPQAHAKLLQKSQMLKSQMLYLTEYSVSRS